MGTDDLIAIFEGTLEWWRYTT